jgi:hypothetical protein
MAINKICSESGTVASWTWYSAVFSMGEPTQQKRFYGATVTTFGGSVTTTYSIDGGGFASAPAAGTFFKTIQIKCTTASGSIGVRDITIMYRPMVGKR